MRVIALGISTLLAATCHAGSIGIYANPDGTGCHLMIPQDGVASVYVIGNTTAADPNLGSIGSGEFRIVGLPSPWVAVAIRDPSLTIAFGDPLGDGVVFGWGGLQSGWIPLFRIVLVAATLEEDVELQVVRHVQPSPPFGYPTTCPWFHYPCGGACDNSGTCVEGISLVINGVCEVGVEPATWSRVRFLYR